MNVEIRRGVSNDVSGILNKSLHRNIPGAEHTLYLCYCMSDSVWIGLVDGHIACMWGLIPPSILSFRAYLWLLTTQLVDKHKFVFIRRSQIYIEEALKQYPEIIGHVQTENRPAKRWLRWLGATLGPTEGHRIPFVIRTK